MFGGKMKIKISRSMTINTGNFTSIKPSVELSVDVKAGVVDEVYAHLSKVADCMMIYEMLSLSEEMQTVNDIGWGRYDLVKHNVDDIDRKFKGHMDELIRYEL
jgi:hypothetical protein